MSKIQTKRNIVNKSKWEARVNHAVRVLNRARYFKLKLKEHKS